MDETPDIQACSSFKETDFSTKAEITTGSRGGSVLLVNNHRYHNFQTNGNKVHWRCVHKNRGCCARAVTVNEYLISSSGTHTCDYSSRKDTDESMTDQQKEESSQDSNLAKEVEQSTEQDFPLPICSKEKSPKFKIVLGRRKGAQVLMYRKKKYYCRRKKNDKMYWECSQKHCYAKIITAKECVIKISGFHVCDQPRKNMEGLVREEKKTMNNNLLTSNKLENSTQEVNSSFTSDVDEKRSTNTLATIISGRRGGQVLCIYDYRYHIRTKNKGRIYWRCMRRGCYATAVTANDLLISTTSPHTCDKSIEQDLEDGEENASITFSPANEAKECNEEVNSNLANETVKYVEQASSNAEIKTNECTFSKGSKGGTIMAVNNYKYYCRTKSGEKAYWKCVTTCCLATAVTFKKQLTSKYGNHICDKPSEETLLNPKPEAESSISSEANETIEFSEPSSKGNLASTSVTIMKGIRGGDVLVVDDRRYHRSKKYGADKQRWRCMRKGCHAIATTVNDTLVSTSGVHLCVNFDELANKPKDEEEVNLSTISNAGTEEDLPENVCSFFRRPKGGLAMMTGNFKYQCNIKKGDKVYWQCFDKKCRANAITVKGHLTGLSGAHTCDQAGEKEEQFKKGNSDETTENETEHLTGHVVSFTKGRQNDIMIVDGQRFHLNLKTGTDKIYWRCSRQGCRAGVTTIKGKILRFRGTHTCEIRAKESFELTGEGTTTERSSDSFQDASSTIVSEEEEAVKSFEQVPNTANESVNSDSEACSTSFKSHEEELVESFGKITKTAKGGLRLLISDHLYYCHSKTNEKIYWRCIEKPCPARVVSIEDHVISTYGVHASDSCSGKSSDFAENGEESSHVSLFPNTGTEKKPSSAVGTSNNQYQLKNTPTKRPRSDGISSDTENAPDAKQRKVLRQTSVLDAFPKVVKAKEKTECIFKKPLVSSPRANQSKQSTPTATKPSRSAHHKHSEAQVKNQKKRNQSLLAVPSTSRANGKASLAKSVKLKQTYTNLEEVKRMPYLQPRVMLSRNLTVAIEKLTERVKLAQDLAIAADKLHALHST